MVLRNLLTAIAFLAVLCGNSLLQRLLFTYISNGFWTQNVYFGVRSLQPSLVIKLFLAFIMCVVGTCLESFWKYCSCIIPFLNFNNEHSYTFSLTRNINITKYVKFLVIELHCFDFSIQLTSDQFIWNPNESTIFIIILILWYILHSVMKISKITRVYSKKGGLEYIFLPWPYESEKEICYHETKKKK